jgi:hypothetical protein
MDVIMKNIALISMASASVCAMFGLLFVAAPKRRELRLLTVALGVAAIVLPVYASFDSLGYPSPWPDAGNYEVLGWKFDEARRAIYTFVKKPEDRRPRVYQVNFDLGTAVDLQNARQHPEHLARVGMVVAPDPEGEMRVRFEFEKRVVIESPAEVAAREEELRAAAARRAQPPLAQEPAAEDDDRDKK